ncbi:hypothetical protein ACE6ED_11655 [Paenibacillus sp. CN-4]|uniref:hypothetical protein n=1 Tax=Paenibacillus nanchangensis TaxID=3348343 RepID=UPI00397E4E23
MSNFSSHSAQQCMDALPERALLIDNGGRIQTMSDSWISWAHGRGIPVRPVRIGCNYLDLMQEITGDCRRIGRLRRALQEIQSGGCLVYSDVFPGMTAQGIRSFRVELFPLLAPGRYRSIVIYHQSVFLAPKLRLQHAHPDSELVPASRYVPICASCSKIRDLRDRWMPIESFIRKTLQAEFTHDICPDCIRKLYPEYASALQLPDDSDTCLPHLPES